MPRSTSEYSRRHALRVGGGVLALVIGGAAGWLDRRGTSSDSAGRATSSTAPPQPTTPATTIISPPTKLTSILDTDALADLDPAIADLGRRHMAAYPDESDLATLLDLLPAATDNPIESARLVIADEFERGDTVSVAGWVLAASESRAAAVVALVCQRDDGQC